MRSTLTKSTALSAVLLLALTACGGDDNSEADGGDEDQPQGENGDNGSSEEIFDFTSGFHEPVTGPYDEVLIEIPSDLLQEDDSYREDRVLDAVVVRAAEHDDAQCAVEIEYLFADGVHDEILSADWNYSADEYRIVITAGVHRETSTMSDNIGDVVDYVNDDLESAVIPLNCAAQAADAETATTVQFNTIDEWVEGEESPQFQIRTSTFAEADVNVDSEGQLHIVRSHIEGWQLDANDNGITN